MERPVSPLEEFYARMVKVIENHGGSAPEPNAAGSLDLIAEFCWALGVAPTISFVKIANAPLQNRQ